MTHNYKALAPEITVFERGWLSSNNILFVGQRSGSALVDTGYCTHSAQTLAQAIVRYESGKRQSTTGHIDCKGIGINPRCLEFNNGARFFHGKADTVGRVRFGRQVEDEGRRVR